MTLPDSLNRKLSGITTSSLDERRAWITSLPQPQAAAPSIDADRRAREQIDREQAERKRLKAQARIQKMLDRKSEKDQLRGIHDKYLAWDARKRGFYDVRKRAARKLIKTRAELGLPPLSQDEVYASVLRCIEPPKPTMREAA